MEKTNPHGNGFGVWDNNKQVIYIKKGIELKELMSLTKEHKEKGNLQQIQHYRITSHGTTNAFNCHGFQIKNGSSNDLEYYTNNDILWHNGTLSMDTLNDMAIQIMTNHKDAMIKTLESEKLPIVKITNYTVANIKEISLQIGNLFANAILEVLILAELGNVDPFGQDAVEKQKNFLK